MSTRRHSDLGEHDRVLRMDAAFRAGDLLELRAAVADPSVIPNGPMPLAIGRCLEYAIYHSPFPFIRTLLEMGADPNAFDHAGFPPLIAAILCGRSRPGSPARPDAARVVTMLLSFGADPNQRGLHDYTALHVAVSEGDAMIAELLLKAGADVQLRTRIDERESARELAERSGLHEIVDLLRRHEATPTE